MNFCFSADFPNREKVHASHGLHHAHRQRSHLARQNGTINFISPSLLNSISVMTNLYLCWTGTIIRHVIEPPDRKQHQAVNVSGGHESPRWKEGNPPVTYKTCKTIHLAHVLHTSKPLNLIIQLSWSLIGQVFMPLWHLVGFINELNSDDITEIPGSKINCPLSVQNAAVAFHISFFFFIDQ